MKTLVLGGTRFIGRRLVEVLLETGHEVTIFNRGTTPDSFAESVTRLTGDRRSGADLRRAVDKRSFDAVFDLLCFDANDAQLVVESLSGKTGRLVHVSTCSVYWCTGDFPCPVPEEEFDRYATFDEQPGSIEYDYGYAKRQAETVLKAAHGERNFPVTIVRPPVVSGTGDPSLRYAGYCERIADGGPVILPDGGNARLRQVWVDDLVRVMASLPARPETAGRAYNLASVEVTSVRGVVEEIASILGRRPDLIDIPVKDLERLGHKGIGTELSPFTQWTSQIPDITRAQTELDWSPAPWREWAGKAIDWWVNEGRSTCVVPPAFALRGKELEMVSSYRSGGSP